MSFVCPSCGSAYDMEGKCRHCNDVELVEVIDGN